MKNAVLRASYALAMLSLAATVLLPCSARAQASTEVLSNDGVVQMLNGKVPKNLIMTKIQSTKTAFDLTPRGLIALNTSKVPGDIIKLMMKASVPDSKEILTNDDVIYMMTAKLPHDIILAKVQATPARFDLTAGALVSLNQNKVPQDVMKAMMAAPAPPTPAPAQPIAVSPPMSAAPAAANAGATGSAAKSAAPAVKLGKIFIEAATTTANGRAVPDSVLEQIAKDLKTRTGKFVLATSESDADFLLVASQHKEVAASGKPVARTLTAKLSVKDGAAWKAATSLESGNVTTWIAAADKVIGKAEDWVKAHPRKP